MGSTPAATTEVRICKSQEAALQVHTKIDRLEAHRAALSSRCTMTTVPDMTLVKLVEECVGLDITLAGHTIVTPLCRGIFKDNTQDKQLIILWSGTNPDRQINYFSWSEDESKWQVPKS
eukprot:6754937-Ditylum_brightwellii.AAC.1